MNGKVGGSGNLAPIIGIPVDVGGYLGGGHTGKNENSKKTVSKKRINMCHLLKLFNF